MPASGITAPWWLCSWYACCACARVTCAREGTASGSGPGLNAMMAVTQREQWLDSRVGSGGGDCGLWKNGRCVSRKKSRIHGEFSISQFLLISCFVRRPLEESAVVCSLAAPLGSDAWSCRQITVPRARIRRAVDSAVEHKHTERQTHRVETENPKRPRAESESRGTGWPAATSTPLTSLPRWVSSRLSTENCCRASAPFQERGSEHWVICLSREQIHQSNGRSRSPRMRSLAVGSLPGIAGRP